MFLARSGKEWRGRDAVRAKNLVRSLATIFRGKDLADDILEKVRSSVSAVQIRNPGWRPKLVAVAVGNHPASKIYLARKAEAAKHCGIVLDQLSLPDTVSQEKLLNIIREANSETSVHGVIVQLPLPAHMSEIRVCNEVLPSKDVDGFTQTSLGQLIQGQTGGMVPCTALAVSRIVHRIGGHWEGKEAVVVGRSHNVGLPIQIILGSDSTKGGLDMTTTLCHRYTPPQHLSRAVSGADLVVSAAGVPGIITRDMVKPGAVLIDVGLTRVCHGGRNIVVGDVARDVTKVASWVTPVPGGVGPCTVACLMHNTLLAATHTLDCC